MDFSGRAPDESSPEYQAFKVRCRREFYAYVASIVDKGYPVSTVLLLIADHIADAGTGDKCEATHGGPLVDSLSQSDRRTLVGLAATFHTIGGYDAHEMGEIVARDSAWVPGMLVRRMMTPVPYGESDAAVTERLCLSMNADEISWLVCVSAGILSGAGMTPEMTRELDPQWTVAEP